MEDEKYSVPNWEKLLSDYARHQTAYQENMKAVEDLNPIVWTWSDASELPMVNPTVDKKALTEYERSKKRASDEHKILSGIESMAKNFIQKHGNIVTAESLRSMVPSHVSSDAIAAAFGINEAGRSPGEPSMELMMARRAYAEHHGIEKSFGGWEDGLEPLRKDEPMEAHAEEFGKEGSMKMRWNDAHNYKKMNVVEGEFDELDPDDQFAIRRAQELSGKNQRKGRGPNGNKAWKLHVWLRPGQEQYFQKERQKYIDKHTDRDGKLTPEAQHELAEVDAERKALTQGKIKPFKHIDRYKRDAVQPGTIAAKNIKMGRVSDHGPKKGESEGMNQEDIESQWIDMKSKQMIPLEGQHGPTAAPMHPGEVHRMKVGRAHVGRRQKTGDDGGKTIKRTEPEKVEGFSMPGIWSATAHPEYSVRRSDPSLRGTSISVLEGRPKGLANKREHRQRVVIPASSWQDLARDVERGVVKVKGRNGATTTKRLTAKERSNVQQAAAALATKAGVVNSPEQFSTLSARTQASYRGKVVRELFRNRHSERFGSASGRSERDRLITERNAARPTGEGPVWARSLRTLERGLRKVIGDRETGPADTQGNYPAGPPTIDHGPTAMNRRKVPGGPPSATKSMQTDNKKNNKSEVLTSQRVPSRNGTNGKGKSPVETAP
ncbi:MAG: hypothetical protein EBU84_13595, partial [Actinobacteria bacterium]|nr:hypothetical protein [Actinomycetota bacterium]